MNGTLLALILTAALGTPAWAFENLTDTVVQRCKAEIETYCSKVTPGEERLLACLYAHEDKLSGRCDFALYDASAELERALTALTYVDSECHADLDKYCATIADEHLLACLDHHHEHLSTRCAHALHDVGLGSH